MRWWLLCAVTLVAARAEATSCRAPLLEQHELDRSQLADTVMPTAPMVSMRIESDDGGGCIGADDPCAAALGRRLVLMVAASDDRTPPDKLGFRIEGASGPLPFDVPGDVRPVDEMISISLAEDVPLDLELAVRAVDLNGNVGPATYVHAEPADSGGCATSRPGSFAWIAAAIALALTSRRARR